MRATVPPALDEQLVSPAFYQDPYPFYDRLRAEAPVAWSETLGAWMLTRYEHVQATLQDPRIRGAIATTSLAPPRCQPLLCQRTKRERDPCGDADATASDQADASRRFIRSTASRRALVAGGGGFVFQRSVKLPR